MPAATGAELAQILSNVGLAGGAVYAVIRLWSALQAERRRVDDLQKVLTGAVERLETEKFAEVERIRTEKDGLIGELQRQQFDLLERFLRRARNGQKNGTTHQRND